MKIENQLIIEKGNIPFFPLNSRLTHDHTDFINQINNSCIPPLKKTIESGFDPIKKEPIEYIQYTNPLTQEIHSNPKNALKLPINDFGLLNLLIYNTQPGIRVSQLNNNLVLKMNDYLTNQPFYTFNGQNLVYETIETLLKQSISEGITPTLKLIPYTAIEPNMARLKAEFNIQEDRDNFDYIYKLENLANPKGKQYKEFRNMCSKFERNINGNAQIVYFRNQDLRPMIKQIEKVMLNWRNIANKPREESDHIMNVIQRFSHYSNRFNTYNAGLYIDGKLSAFSFNEVVNHKYIISHFGHANKRIPGIFQYFDYVLANKLFTDGYDYINLQQDLGKPGLRQFKQSYRPEFFLKKYTISPKT